MYEDEDEYDKYDSQTAAQDKQEFKLWTEKHQEGELEELKISHFKDKKSYRVRSQIINPTKRYLLESLSSKEKYYQIIRNLYYNTNWSKEDLAETFKISPQQISYILFK